MSAVEALYKEKDKVQSYYTLKRTDVVRVMGHFLKKDGRKLVRVLEIGCSGGGTGQLIKEQFGVAFYAGVELMPAAAEQAATRIDWVKCDNIEDMIAQGRLGQLPEGKFDAILFLDVLEHLYNPWEVVDQMHKLLNPNGLLIGSIPNAGNLYILWKLMRDQFEYEDEGLLDRTHLRFFTLQTIKNMLRKCYDLVHLESNHDTWKTMNWQQKFFYVPTLGLWKRLFIRQYIFIGQAKGA
jgi:2-polyprenyl-3-methyl-5-hydroxy-6-metoxy-1,4-benzoquinol methylase